MLIVDYCHMLRRYVYDTPYRGGRCAAAILTDRNGLKQKYLDYVIKSI